MFGVSAATSLSGIKVTVNNACGVKCLPLIVEPLFAFIRL